MFLCVHVPTVSLAADEAPAVTFWSVWTSPGGTALSITRKETRVRIEIETCTVDWTRRIIFLVRKKDGKKDESRGWAKCFWLDMRTHARTSEHAAPLYVAKGRHQRAAQSMQQAVGNTVATATHGSYTCYRLMTLTCMPIRLSPVLLYQNSKEKEKRKHGPISSRQSSCLSVEHLS